MRERGLLEELEDVASNIWMDEEVEDQNWRNISRTELHSSMDNSDSLKQSNEQCHEERVRSGIARW